MASAWLPLNHFGVVGPRHDCAVVAKFFRYWTESVGAVNAEDNTDDPLTIADRYVAIGDHVRAMAKSVSSPAIKDHLNKWADGMAIMSRLQRDSGNRPAEITLPPDELADAVEAGHLLFGSAEALRKSCPDAAPRS
ncbi:hypothetical protein [Mycobacterium branderi]|nr:hypothetical protein [Mycobacterium branderi]MCV7236297.1 hypothetical protein [Mycobacterium branderi]ORA35470.1 hypothetical protein BST20_17935 [Mycobacterium branderi]